MILCLHVCFVHFFFICFYYICDDNYYLMGMNVIRNVRKEPNNKSCFIA